MSQVSTGEARRDWRRLTEEFKSESARASALVAAALLDSNLEDLLRAFLVPDRSEVETVLGTSMKSFGARIRACYCLGLLSPDECHDLRIIKSVRNYFAHNLYASFDEPETERRCRSLRLIKRVFDKHGELPPRRVLEQSACILSVLIVKRCDPLADERLQMRPELTGMRMQEQCPLVEGDTT